MLFKTLLATLALSTIVGAARTSTVGASPWGQAQGDEQAAIRSTSKAGSQDIGRLLPTPQWVLDNRDELGVTEADLSPLRSRIKQARYAMGENRKQLRSLRAGMRRALTTEPVDRANAENLFETMLTLEADMKRAQLAVRLDVLGQLSPEQRERVRTMSETASIQRRKLRRRIEEIRTLGRQLRRRSGEASKLYEQLPVIEELIRAGSLREAALRAKALHDDLKSALLPQGARD